MKVYLIKNGDGHYKVGYTKHSVKYRMEQLQTGSSSELEYVSECSVRHAPKVEAALHRQYKQYHIILEWFDLPDDVVKNFADHANRIDEMFQMLLDSGNPFV